MFAYCGNNPVIASDESGEFWHIVIGAVVGAVVGAVTAALEGKSATEIAVSAAVGAASGALAASGAGAVVQIAGSAAISAAGSVVSQGLTKGFDNIDYGEVASQAIAGGIAGATGGTSKGTAKHLMQLGKNATHRVTSALLHNGVAAAGKELIKAGRYYISQTATVFIKPVLKEGVESLISAAEKQVFKSFIIECS